MRPWPAACETSARPTSIHQPNAEAGSIGSPEASATGKRKSAVIVRGHRHQVQRGLAAVAQPFHGEDVARVEHRGHHAERVAGEAGGGELEAGVHEQRDAGERGGRARRETGALGRWRRKIQAASVTKIDARLASRVEFATEVSWIELVPEGEVAGEGEARREQQRPFAGIAPGSRPWT